MPNEREDFADAVERLGVAYRRLRHTQVEDARLVKQYVDRARQHLQTIVNCAESAAMAEPVPPTEPDASPAELLSGSEPLEPGQ